jgi:hypothetical protein
MPIRVTLRVRRLSPLAHEQSPTAKKQRTTQLPISHIHIESDIANAVEEVNVKTEAIDEESTGESFLDILKALPQTKCKLSSKSKSY